MRWTRTLTALLVAAAAAGCATRPPVPALAEGPRMIDLYRGTAPGGDAGSGRAGETGAGPAAATCGWWLFAWPCAATAPVDREKESREEGSYARTAANELEVLFPRLPNPDIYIYVPPHLATASRLPVPGYTTAVPLYERVEYALPGEMPGAAEAAADDAAPSPEASP